jgi:hypothetical protein
MKCEYNECAIGHIEEEMLPLGETSDGCYEEVCYRFACGHAWHYFLPTSYGPIAPATRAPKKCTCSD